MILQRVLGLYEDFYVFTLWIFTPWVVAYE